MLRNSFETFIYLRILKRVLAIVSVILDGNVKDGLQSCQTIINRGLLNTLLKLVVDEPLDVFLGNVAKSINLQARIELSPPSNVALDCPCTPVFFDSSQIPFPEIGDGSLSDNNLETVACQQLV